MEQEIVNILSKNYSKIADLTPKCDKCHKSVYVVEELKIGDKRFHKICFKCSSCFKTLDKNTVNEHENDYFCNNCYSKSFGPKGYGYGSVVMPETNLENKLETHEPPSQFQSYEPAVSTNNDEPNSFFKIVLKKSVSNFINDNKADFTEGYDQTSKWTKDYFKHSSIGAQKKANEKVILIQSNNCFRCKKAVYAVEELRSANNIFHKLCYKCNSCNKLLETNSSTELKNDLYCRNCYSKKFGPKVYANDDKPEAITHRQQYETNESSGNHFQGILQAKPVKSAFSPYYKAKDEEDLAETSSLTTKMLLNNYTKLISDNQPALVQRQQAQPRSKSVQYATDLNMKSFEREPIKRETFVIKSALKKTQSTEVLNRQSSRSDTIRNKFGDSAENCTRCEQRVYAAEKLLGGKKVYHAICFKCNQCNKTLNLTNYCEHNDEILCKPCLNGKNSVQIKV